MMDYKYARNMKKYTEDKKVHQVGFYYIVRGRCNILCLFC